MSVKLAVIEALDLDPDVPAAALGVLVEAGCVTLLGDAGSEGRRRLAREAAFKVVGARVVVDAMHDNAADADKTIERQHRRVGVLIGELLSQLTAGDPLPVRATITDGQVSLHGRLPSAELARELIEAVRDGIDLPLDSKNVVAP